MNAGTNGNIVPNDEAHVVDKVVNHLNKKEQEVEVHCKVEQIWKSKGELPRNSSMRYRMKVPKVE